MDWYELLNWCELIFFIDNFKKSIKVNSTCYLSCGYFFCYRKTLITKYLLSYLNCFLENFLFFGTVKNSWKKNRHFCKASKIQHIFNRFKNNSWLFIEIQLLFGTRNKVIVPIKTFWKLIWVAVYKLIRNKIGHKLTQRHGLQKKSILNNEGL